MTEPVRPPPYAFHEGVPKLSAEVSADELLDIVGAVIRDDARCFNAVEWISPPGFSLSATQEPECGTVACVAGWIAVVTRGDLSVEEVARTEKNAGDIACGILGMTWDEVGDLFESGTLAEAADPQIGIARIERFQQAHRAHLQRRRVSPSAAQRVIEGWTF